MQICDMTGACGSRQLTPGAEATALLLALATRPIPSASVTYDIPLSGFYRSLSRSLSFSLALSLSVSRSLSLSLPIYLSRSLSLCCSCSALLLTYCTAFSPAVDFQCVGGIRYEAQIAELDLRVTAAFVVCFQIACVLPASPTVSCKTTLFLQPTCDNTTTFDSSGTCVNLTVCRSDQFQSVPNTLTSDR
jgi:hypothetical protein